MMLKRGDFLLGGMLFSFFMGAGNIIFPPSVGLQSGESFLQACLGFLATAVGLPLLVFFAVVRNRHLSDLFKGLPAFITSLLIFACYFALVPTFAVPRTGVVAYEVFVKPLLSQDTDHLFLYSLCYFALVLWLSWSPRALIDRIGKMIAPVLILMLLVIVTYTFFQPYAPFGPVQGVYQTQPFLEGLLQGYRTMDALAALVFGVLMSQAFLHQQASKSLIPAGLLAGVGLSCVYLCLTYLGATAGDLVSIGSHGADILTQYTQWLFGGYGRFLLGSVLFLACLTSAIGLVVACGRYFHEICPRLSYQTWICLITIFSWLISNLGLKQIIQFSLPVLSLLYPLVIVLVFFGFCRHKIQQVHITIPIVFTVTFIFSGLDVCQQVPVMANIVSRYASWIPLFDSGLAWLLPALGTLFGIQIFFWGRYWFVSDKTLTDQAS